MADMAKRVFTRIMKSRLSDESDLLGAEGPGWGRERILNDADIGAVLDNIFEQCGPEMATLCTPRWHRGENGAWWVGAVWRDDELEFYMKKAAEEGDPDRFCTANAAAAATAAPAAAAVAKPRVLADLPPNVPLKRRADQAPKSNPAGKKGRSKY